MPARDVSVIIPGRNEIFMQKTIENVLENLRADTEVISVCDGYWPDPTIHDHPRVNIIHFSESIGQRAATNAGARLSQAKYIMKLDAHCSVNEGFDVKLMEDCQPNWTMVPLQYNLHAFDWVCTACGHREYQGVQPSKCKKCEQTEFHMDVLWQRRKHKKTVSWRFDSDLHFQYWPDHKKRPEVIEQGKRKLIETMSCLGACWFLERDRYWELGGMDEDHGSWGQMGTEVACKTWLSGGELITSRKTWFAHMFRTGNFSGPGISSWPYPITEEQQETAREHSKDMWRNGKWPGGKHPLSWLLKKFWPIPGWTEEELKAQEEREQLQDTV